VSAFPGITAPPSQTLKPVLTAPVPQPQAGSVRQISAFQPRHQTERLDPVEHAREPTSGLPRRLWLAGAFVLAVVLGVGGASLLLGGGGAAPLPAPEPLVKVDPPRVDPPREPAVVPAQEPDADVDAAVVAVAEVEVEVEQPAKPVKPTPGPRRPKPVAVFKPAPEKPVERPPAPKEEPIPEGEGKLVINVGGNGRHSVVVQGEDWGPPPIARKVSSGTYRVQVKLEDGSSSGTKTSVMPDKTTVLELDPASLKWSTRSK
jgi:hypothetical protein